MMYKEPLRGAAAAQARADVDGQAIRRACAAELARFQKAQAVEAARMPMPRGEDSTLPSELPAGAAFGHIQDGDFCRFVDLERGANYILLPTPSPAQIMEDPLRLASRMRDEHLVSYGDAPPLSICAEVLMLGYRHYNCPYRLGHFSQIGAASWARMELKHFMLVWCGGHDNTLVGRRFAHLAPATRGQMPDGSAAAQLNQFVLVDHKPMPARELR